MTSQKIGVNLRVSGNCNQGGRKYMEDRHSITFYQRDGKDYDFAYFAIFDGHGGSEASSYAKDYLLNEITKYDAFWSESDEDVMWAIKSGFLDTHHAMWKQLDKWPKRLSGYQSTAGTTCSVAIVRSSKIYIGHVGDSAIVIGSDIGTKNAIVMKSECLTKDHKPECPDEKRRIENSGGEVLSKSGVQRVVWNRPKMNHRGPIRRSTPIDKVPFLAVARSLGDLWSYDYLTEEFAVSPNPDVSVKLIDPSVNKCLILGSDGLWNMLSPEEAVDGVTDLEYHFEDRVVHDANAAVSYWINPAERLVAHALKKWKSRNLRADNISAIVVFIDPLGPSKLTILRKLRENYLSQKDTREHVPVESTMKGSLYQSVLKPERTNLKMKQSPKLYTSHPKSLIVVDKNEQDKTQINIPRNKNHLLVQTKDPISAKALSNIKNIEECETEKGNNKSQSIVNHSLITLNKRKRESATRIQFGKLGYLRDTTRKLKDEEYPGILCNSSSVAGFNRKSDREINKFQLFDTLSSSTNQVARFPVKCSKKGKDKLCDNTVNNKQWTACRYMKANVTSSQSTKKRKFQDDHPIAKRLRRSHP